MITQVVLIRPGATAYDEQNRVQGVLDLPLSDRGRAEVEALAEQLARLDLQALYCGLGEHVLRTAEMIGRAAGLRPKRLDDLRNLDQGLWQGLQVEEIRRRNVKVFRQWLEDPRTVCPPEGETIEDALERIRDALIPLLKRHRSETFALVVADPLALLVGCFLRRSPRIQLEDQSPTGSFERIEVPGDILRNGDSGA